MRRFLLIVMLMLPLLLWGQTSEQPVVLEQQDIVQQDTVQQVTEKQSKPNLKQRITQRINDKLNEPFDTTRDSRYWWRAMKHGKINFKDSTMGYPKFLMFCYKTYVWGDKAFNSYDTAYVQSTGKNWKLILKSENWVDSYIGTPFKDVRVIMNSNLVSNIGVSLSFMAVSLGYSISISNLLHGGKVSNKAEFSFTCARFTADAYYWENQNDINIIYTDKNVDDERHKFRQSGISRKAMGLTAYYFFNNRRYAQAAAYCFSKYQKRSAGSFLAGFSLQHYDVKVDAEQLAPEAQAYVPAGTAPPRILYNDYCVLVGYGYNWVLGRKWLLNITATPYLGYRYNILPQPGEKQSALSLNLRGRIGVVYNHKNFFMGLQGYADHHRYKKNDSRLVNSMLQFTALAGIRF
ncbi:MAG: DUF4421 domain-containing protein [Muribaculaceae bacterium]|nr:DUF4421 domain-containing protein [Muribaculaceae bacterium]